MPGIDLDFMCHRLTMDPKVRPVRQRRRKSNDERKVNLDLLDEVREEARIKAEALKRRVE